MLTWGSMFFEQLYRFDVTDDRRRPGLLLGIVFPVTTWMITIGLAVFVFG